MEFSQYRIILPKTRVIYFLLFLYFLCLISVASVLSIIARVSTQDLFLILQTCYPDWGNTNQRIENPPTKARPYIHARKKNTNVTKPQQRKGIWRGRLKSHKKTDPSKYHLISQFNSQKSLL